MTDDLHLLTGGYVLDCLEPADHERFERHLESCERCRAEVGMLAATIAELDAAGAVPPPDSLRDRVLRQVAATPQLSLAGLADRRPIRFVPPPMRRYSPRVPEPAPPRRAWRTVVAVAGAAAVAAVAFTLGTWWSGQRAQQTLVVAPADEITHVVAAPDAEMRPLTMAGGTDAKVIAAPSMGKAVIMAERFPAAPQDMVYQVWVMDAAGSKHAMQTFVPDSAGGVEALVTGDFRDATRLEVTVEPSGGSAEPSSRPVAVATLT